MTSERRNLWLAIAAVAFVQAMVLGWMIWERVQLLADGREVVLEVVPVDPRSLFRGDYVVLGYPISRVEAPTDARPTRGAAVYVTLKKTAEGTWKPVRTNTVPPTTTSPDEVVLKGRVQYVFAAADGKLQEASVQYGIESFFVPEGVGKELEQLVRDRKISALIAVDQAGNAGIKGLLVDGKRVYEEPLL